MPPFQDLTGRRFGHWTVLRRAESSRDSRGYPVTRWLCRCDCNKEKVIIASSLSGDHSTTCGCRMKQHGSNAQFRRDYPEEFNAWKHMWQRCTVPTHAEFHHYGGRGITVDERWRSVFVFYVDMGQRPGPKYSIERRNNSLGYSKDNCYWATQTEQMRNTRRSQLLTYQGITLCQNEWASRLDLDYQTIQYRRKHHPDWPIDKILAPARWRRRR